MDVIGVIRPDDATEDETEAFQHLSGHAMTVFMQTASSSILKKIVVIEGPHAVWNWLYTEFYRDSAYAMVNQITTLSSLSTKYDPSKPITKFISLFEAE